MKLNLASGTDLRPPPWVNLDVVARWPSAPRGCDVLWDARTQGIPFADESIDEVYAGYLFLHLAPQHHKRVLAEIRRVLMPGGRLVVGEVDMEILLPRWLEHPADPYLSGLVWGEQGDVHGSALAEFDKHCQGFTELSLRHFLHSGGFPDARRIRVHGPAVFYELTLETYK